MDWKRFKRITLLFINKEVTPLARNHKNVLAERLEGYYDCWMDY